MVRRVLSPAWTSDWITPDGRRKLDEYGIAPPARAASARSLRSSSDNSPVACPRCRSSKTEAISEFGSTPCKALHRCLDCLEPFERFKCI
jgi:ring-1,2-phenylacetyl-CoA epoxidase subunit PaaD